MTPSRWTIEWHAELPSTMIRARELAMAGAPSGSVVVADYQSQGRGTHGRTWLAAPGTCLMFTVLVRPHVTPENLHTLPFRVSSSIAGALRVKFGLTCTVREPNDILVDERKLCGVLCTSHVQGSVAEWVLCGVGLNTHMTAEQLPLETATSLLVAGVTPPTHAELLHVLLHELVWLLEGE